MWVITFLFLLGAVTRSMSDPVDTQCPAEPAELLPELDRRTRATATSTQHISDYALTERWYSVKNAIGPYKMPDVNTIPAIGQCGTFYPMYLSEPHPDLEEGKEIETSVCLVYSSTSLCYTEIAIKIRNCGGNLEYLLKPTPAVSSAYCFDSPDIQGIEDLTPAPEYTIPGSIEVDVSLEFLVVMDTETPYLQFTCTFISDPQYFYTVEWFVNDQFVKAFPPVVQANLHSTRLLEEHLLALGYKLQITIKCGVSVSAVEIGLRTQMQTSDGFFAGLEVLTPIVDIDASDGGGTVVLRPTVPIGCKKVQQTSLCSIALGMFDPIPDAYTCTETSVAVQDSQACGTEIAGIGREEVGNCNKCWRKNVTFSVTSTNQDNYKDRNIFTLQLQTSDFTGHEIWNLVRPNDIQVHIHDNKIWQRRSCSSVIDPHMTTANGYPFENQNPGEYILYRHKVYDLEVQEKMVSCNRGRAYCACAVSIRAGGDIFVMNLCGSVKYIGFPSCKEEILDVWKRHDNWYQVYTPIGTYIDIRQHGSVMNIHVYLSPKDKNSIEGLCGNFNDIQTDDLTLRNGNFIPLQKYPTTFTSDWRVKTGESLLHHSRHDPGLWSKKYNLCVCPGKIVGNDEYQDIHTSMCSVSEALICTIDKKRPGKKESPKYCNIRKKRSARHNAAELNRRFALGDESEPSPHIVAKRNAMTYEEAYTFCMDALSTTGVAAFQDRLPTDDFNKTVSNCALDLEPFGDTSWVSAHEEDMKVVVSNENTRDVDYAEANPEEIQSFENIACPDDCNNQGNCSNGTCTCNTGFYGDDCSIDIATPLTLDDLEGGGFCDKSEGYNCHECFMVQTSNLLEGFFCQFSGKIMYLDGTVEELPSVSSHGERLDIYQGLCCPPEDASRRQREAPKDNPVFTTSYSVAISNDGVNYGNERQVHVYDSVCQEFSNETGDIEFALKSGTCFIDGACAAEGDSSASAFCYVCDGTADSYNWLLSKNTCFIDETCFTNGTISSSDSCYACIAGTHQSEWTYACGKDTVTDNPKTDKPNPNPDPNNEAGRTGGGFLAIAVCLGLLISIFHL